MKKNYTVSLDEDKVDEFKRWLEPRGISFSGCINSLIEEQLFAFGNSPSGEAKLIAMQLMQSVSRIVTDMYVPKKKVKLK
jgi:hypothetical protein